MPVLWAARLLSLLCVPNAVSAGDAPPADRWDVKAHQEGISSVRRKAYQQLARLRDYQATQVNESGTLYYDYPKGNPMAALRDTGISALPVLAEALDDNTPSKTSTRAHGVYRVWRVSELAALLIDHIADHFFDVEADGGVSIHDIRSHRGRIAEFQKQVLD
jgi:hypothetical protein